MCDVLFVSFEHPMHPIVSATCINLFLRCYSFLFWPTIKNEQMNKFTVTYN